MNSKDTERGTFLIQTKPSSPPYVHCDSRIEYQSPSSLPSITESCTNSKPIKLPIVQLTKTVDGNGGDSTSPTPLTAQQVNQTLNLHLGLPFDPRTIRVIRAICLILDKLLLLIEVSAFSCLDAIPLTLRQSIILLGWKLYFPFHKWTLANRTGIHKQVSYEYHALTTIMYWGRVFPVNLRRIRFSLSQLCNFHGPSAYPPSRPLSTLKAKSSSSSSCKNVLNINGAYIETIPVHEDMKLGGILFSIDYDMDQKTILTPPKNSEGGTVDSGSGKALQIQTSVNGYYIQHGASPSKKVILWLFGGAYLGGDAKGNLCLGTFCPLSLNLQIRFLSTRLTH